MRARSILWAVLALAGCNHADALVVVSVQAQPSVANVAVLRTTSTAGAVTARHDFGAAAAPFTIPPARTFAIQVPGADAGPFALHVEAYDSGGRLLASGDGVTTTARARRSDLAITLGPATPMVVSEPIWIGSGGSATATSGEQLNASFGGTDTVGSTNAPSGAQLTPGFFSAQTY
jgi:hypothetical protein